MASYQQLYYCKNCKKNVSVNDKGQCLSCHSTQIKKSWSVRFRIQELGCEKQKRLTGFNTKKEAEKAYFDFMTTCPSIKDDKTTHYIFENLLDSYFKSCAPGNEESTLYDKMHIFDKYITPYFKGKDLQQVTKLNLQDWQNQLWKTKSKLTNKNLSWKYLTKIRGYLYNFLEYCENLYDIPNLLENVKIPKNKEMTKPIRFWELETFNKFAESVEEIEWKTLWYVFMFTGARFNEVRALTIDDIKDNVIYITKALPGKKVNKDNKLQSKTTKNQKIVIKQIPDVLVNQLHEYYNWRKDNNINGKYLFGGEKPLAEETIRRKLIKQTQDAEVEYLNPHGFRHSYVSLLINLGISTKIIAELIGDNEIQVIKTYGHLYADAKSNAINLLNTKINAGCA